MSIALHTRRGVAQEGSLGARPTPLTGVLKRVSGANVVATTPKNACGERRVAKRVRVVDADDGYTTNFSVAPRE